MKQRRKFSAGTLPPLAGGQDPLAVLADIRAKLAQPGQTPEQRQQLESDAQAALKAASDQPAVPPRESSHEELERLRREAAERATEDAVKAAAAQIGSEIVKSQVNQAESVQRMLVDQVAKYVNGQADDLDPQVKALLAAQQAPSRMLSEHADPAYAAQIAAQPGPGGKMGSFIEVQKMVAAGHDRDVDEFVESKSLARLTNLIYRSKQQPYTLTEKDQKALALTTDSAGGFLVPPQWMDDILGLLRAGTVIFEAGPRRMPLGKAMNQVSISSGGTAQWGTENAATVPSEQVFAQAQILSPRFLSALTPVSNHLLRTSDDFGIADAEDIVRQDLSEIMSLAIDLGFLQGSGGQQPTGLKNIAGLTNLTTPLGIAADGDYFDDDLARNMVARYRTINVRNPRLAWFFNPVLINQLEGLKDNEGRYLLETRQLVVNADQRSGSLWGIPFYTTTQIPTNVTRGATGTTTYVMLVNMPETIVGESRDLTLDMSSEASYTPDGGTTWINAFQNKQTLFRAEWIGDITHRRPNQIMLLEGIRTV